MDFDEKYWRIVLKRVYESQNSSEKIELISDDDKRIPIHRVILTAASKYFAASFRPSWNSQEGDREKGRKLEYADGETLKMIVDYCYTGHIKLTEENVETFLAIALRYQFDLLEENCCSFYVEILSVTNSVEALMFADKFHCAKLRQAALDFICENFESVPTAEVQKLDHQLLQEILGSDQITSLEELVFDRLLKWSELEEREPCVPNLLKLIRLQHIKLEILKDSVEVFYEKFHCTKLMFAEYKRRLSNNHFDSGFRRRRSLFCLFKDYEKKYDHVVEDSVIKVSRFERMSRTWQEIAEFALGKRGHCTVVLNQNKMYALGGKLNGASCNTVSAFDLNSRQEEILPNMNISRAKCTSIVFGEYIYLFGGYNKDPGYLRSCERFDIKRKIWTEIESMSVARAYASAVVMNGCIYIAGGYNGSTKSTFEAYDPMRNIWKELAPMNISRYSFALIQSNGLIYAIDDDNTIEKYDLSKNQWTEISRLECTPISSGLNFNGEIYVMNIDGELRQIKIDESDTFSFLPWVFETKFKSEFLGRHILCIN